MPRRSASLHVYVDQRPVGVYQRAANGAIGFRYLDSWLDFHGAFPLSQSLPLSPRPWTGEAVQSVFDGLLPDAPATRETLAAHTGAASAEIFDLLAEIGRDCVGAYRFLRPDEDPAEGSRMHSRPLDDAEIARRIAALARQPLGLSAGDEDFRISIDGNQDKTAFLRVGDEWHLPVGGTPTSHIFKPRLAPRDDVDMWDSPWNEWFCLKLCGAFGLRTAQADVHYYGGQLVLIVERFDRRWHDGVLYRLPQEDICQALGLRSSAKYESDGGPGMLRILRFLERSADPGGDRKSFLKAQMLFWLLSAPDGHAKNFSIFLRPGGFSLTPIYDVLSAAPYHPYIPRQRNKLAMAVGRKRHYRIQEIMPRHFRQTARQAGVPEDDVTAALEELERTADAALQSVTAEADRAGMASDTSDSIAEAVRRRVRLLRPPESLVVEPGREYAIRDSGPLFEPS